MLVGIRNIEVKIPMKFNWEQKIDTSFFNIFGYSVHERAFSENCSDDATWNEDDTVIKSRTFCIQYLLNLLLPYNALFSQK